MTTCIFRSPLAFRLQSFLDVRCALGRKGDADRKNLIYLDRFLMSELKYENTITREIAVRWIKDMEHLSVGTRINRLSILRQFCVYLSNFYPETYLIHGGFLPRRTRPAPYIYTPQEIRSIIDVAKQLGPARSLRPAVISTLIGLLYTAGLRISEALKLTISDVDFRRRLLLIRETKFKKTRYVPLSSTTTHRLAAFLRQRKRAGFPMDPNSPIFLNANGRAYGKERICCIFLEIIRSIGMRGPKGTKGPRLHDLRHSFAVNRLAAWYREDVNLFAKLPLLATYLGHSSVVSTQVYLHATAELLEKVSERFHKYFSVSSVTNHQEDCHVEKY